MPRQSPSKRASIGPDSNAVCPQGTGTNDAARSRDRTGDNTDPSNTAGGGDSEPTGSYTVGYRRPPQHNRFQPGQSGNPKGRKKQSRNLPAIVKQVLEEDIRIQVGNRVRRMPAIEALVRTTLTHALKREPKAVASLTILMRQAGYGADHDEGGADLLATSEINAVVEDFIARFGLKDTGTPTAGGSNPPPPVDLPPPKAKE